MRTTVFHHAILFAIALTVYFTNLGGPRLWDRDEPRNAGCAAEMLAAGDWVTPVFNAELRTHKPVLLYWLMMASYSVFGVDEFSARFCSAVLGVGTCIITYHIGRRLFGPRVGFWAALVLLGSPLFGISARAATPDSLLIFLSSAALLIFVMGTFRPQRDGETAAASARLRHAGHYYPQSRWVLTAMFAVMGLAVLAKGPVGLVMPTAVIGMFLLVMRLDQQPVSETKKRRRLRDVAAAVWRPFAPRHFLATCRYMRPGLAIAVVAAVSVPWYVWVGLRTNGEWLQGFFLQHNYGRVVTSMEGHGGSVVYYPAALLIGFFPWSVFAAPVVLSTWRRLRGNGTWQVATIFATCWAMVYIAIFSIAQTKLPSYVLPMYPAVAILAAAFVVEWIEGRSLVSRYWPYAAACVLAVISLGSLVALPLIARQYLPGEEVLGGLFLIPLGGAILCLVFVWRKSHTRAATAFAGSAVVLALLVLGFATMRIDRYRTTDQLLSVAFENARRPKLASYACLEPSWVFYAKRPITEFKAPMKKSGVREFLRNERDGYLITTRQRVRELRFEMPVDVQILAEFPYFLEDEQLVVIGRRAVLSENPTPIERR